MKLENAEVTKANDKVTDPPDTNIGSLDCDACLILSGSLMGGTGSLVNVNGARRAVAWTDRWLVNVSVKIK
jgi:hypothetical protein